MTNKKIRLGMLVMALIFGMMIFGCGGGSTGSGNNGSTNNGESGIIQSDFQGTYNVYGYYHNFNEELIPWALLADPSYDSLKAQSPSKFEFTSNSIKITGGLYNGQIFPGRTSGNTLYGTIGGMEVVIGTFSSGDFHMTYGLDYASQGAYVVYKK